MHPIKSKLATGAFALGVMACAMLAGCDETARRTTPSANPGSTSTAGYVVKQPRVDTKTVPLELERWKAPAAESR